jgi:hypothetical protein
MANNHDRSQEVLTALHHPLRRRILEAHVASEGEHVLSPVEVSRALHEPLGDVSYHVGRLLDFAALDLVGTKRVRGAVQHFYRPRIDFLEHPSVVATLGLRPPS